MAGPTPDVSLTRFGAAVLFIELWFCCHGNALEARAAGELFLDWCCNVSRAGQVGVPSCQASRTGGKGAGQTQNFVQDTFVPVAFSSPISPL